MIMLISSGDNVNKTHLPSFFITKIKQIALVDDTSIYEQEAINGHVNDYFVSRKYYLNYYLF
jgi:hypothetical protein